MAVRAETGRVQVAQKLRLTVEATAEEGVDVELPLAGGTLEKWVVRESRDFPGVPVEGGRQWRQEYVLETYSAGTQTIPSLTARFSDRRDPNEPIESEVSSPPLEIEVASLLEGEFDPAEYADIKGTVALPRTAGREWLVWTAGILAGLVVLAVVIFLWRRRVRRPAGERVIPPHEWALAELRRLQADALVEKGQVHAFYFRLTWIVRRYIEMRFAIMAGEQTTREFLEAARHHPALGGAYRELLAGFLTAGDMVKFALHVPESGEIEQAFAAARAFVDQTAEAAVARPQEVAA